MFLTEEEYDIFTQTTPISSAVVNLTDNCNLRCPYCFTEHNTRKIKLDTLKKVVDFLINQNKKVPQELMKTIVFFGGEPMLMFEEIIKPFLIWSKEQDLIEKHKFIFSMTTNGTLLTKERLKFLRDYNCHLLLSIDGDKETQDDQRPGINGNSSFDLIFPNIPNILYYNPYITFRATVEPRNADKVFKNYLFAREQGFKSIFFAPNQGVNWDKETTNIYLMELLKCLLMMYDDIKNNEPTVIVSNFLNFSNKLFPSIYQNQQKKKINEDKYRKIYRCGLGTIGIGVDCDGIINGCQERNTYLDDDIFKIGNLETGIDRERHLRLLNTFLSSDTEQCREYSEFCQTCPFFTKCSLRGCPSVLLGKKGEYRHQSYVMCAANRFYLTLSQFFIDQIDKETDPQIKERLEFQLFLREVES